MYYRPVICDCQHFKAKKWQTLLKFLQLLFLRVYGWFFDKKAPAAQVGQREQRYIYILLIYYLRTNRMPSVLGPQWLEMVQPARVT